MAQPQVGIPWWKPWLAMRSGKQRRLRAAITSLREKLNGMTPMPNVQDPAQKPAWVRAASALLDMAEKKSKEGNKALEEGWQFFFEAHRMHLIGLNREALDAVAKALAIEVEKKLSSSWRGTAALSLLTQNPKGGPPLPLANIMQAMEIRDEHSGNVYRRLDLVLHQMKFLVVVLVFIVASLYGIIARMFGGKVPLAGEIESGSLQMFSLLFLFGMLGGALSTALTLARSPSRSPLPDQFLERWVAFMRPLLGGVAATVVYIAFLALDASIDIKGNRGATFIALAIASGFSERLVLSAMEKIANKT